MHISEFANNATVARLLLAGVGASWFYYTYKFARQLFVAYGAYFLDAGWQAYSFCTTNGLNPPGKEAQWGTSSILGLHGFFSTVLSCRALAIFSNDGVQNYWILLGIQTSVVALLGYCLGRAVGASRIVSIGLAVSLPATPIVQGTIGYPHLEVYGASLTAIGAMIWLNSNSRRLRPIGLAFIVVGGLSREDVGLHLAIVCIVSLVLLQSSISNTTKRRLKALLLSGLSVSIVNWGLMRIAFSGSGAVAGEQYGSTNPLKILGALELSWEKIVTWVSLNQGLIAFCGVLVIVSSLTKDRRPLVTVASFIPWAVINFCSGNPAKTYLGIYHLFPWVIYLVALSIPQTLIDSARRATRENSSNSKVKSIGVATMIGTLTWGALTLFSNPPSGSSHVSSAVLREVSATKEVEKRVRSELAQVKRDLQQDGSRATIDSGIASWLAEFDSRILIPTDVNRIYFFRRNVLEAASVESIATANGLTESRCFSSGVLAVRISVTDPLVNVRRLSPCD